MAGNLVQPILSSSVGKTIVEAMALTPSITGAAVTGFYGSPDSMFRKGSQAQTVTLSWSKFSGRTFIAAAVAAVPLPAGLLKLAAAIGVLLAVRHGRGPAAA